MEKLTVMVSAELKNRMDACAAATGVTLSAMVRLGIEGYLRGAEVAPAPVSAPVIAADDGDEREYRPGQIKADMARLMAAEDAAAAQAKAAPEAGPAGTRDPVTGGLF